MNLRQQLIQGLNIAMVVCSAFMFWKGLALVTGSSSPIVVVLSGSMEPAFQRGDILFLWNRNQYVDVGDIVVYNIKEKEIPIVHRVMREHKVIPEVKTKKRSARSKKPVHEPGKVRQLLLTKGDNNPTDDLPLYAYGQTYLDREDDIVGKVMGYIPKLGYVTILITENVYFKYALLGLLGLSTLLQKE
ncbi:unnamed protein product [Kuraishia capsulata CBS 1993]|uniref:Signal peptidase complex catalytic subunit SEC11 n=1 Tax=Kuraishia capsulata CBS 1993 TaxID=1382522 RepID=W6MQV7_9ASCO|nr:uncharacterized protein KUCA_T00005106001 [Kuraishia capsulata CBS 1993]CDK29119.1 unnamed protein product [Kuraishia capsulata CBS 1993]